MPTVMRIGAFRFYFYSHEPNEPPHIHIDRGEATIKVWLGSLEVARSRGTFARMKSMALWRWSPNTRRR